ncbi:hypothetical protein BJ138DRAFT_1154209 [Hygrophoropsis aurantiaca]|uniref:Uncharacterized protein n=1 Tax=Hygrophoropsis aurantiaca TaxID=72124 RepID=A0ACB8AA24_9AGAM|nr:hypothetical protein BJ138DRAFT_1154209 [Hygrophoropsis aurantiaca]
MVQFFDEIPEFLFEWMKKQQMFWVASAPLMSDGHVNVSPKGTLDCFHLVDAHRVWYEDLSGSGIETISHLRENGRITVMFTAFDGPPRITRLFGTGTVHEFGTPEYHALIPAETRKPGSRAAIVVDIHKVSTSCGYAVPFYQFVSHRTQLLRFFDKKESAESDENGLKAYWNLKNLRSLDGLPGLLTAPDSKDTPSSSFDIDAVVQKSKSKEKGTSDKVGLLVGFAAGALVATAVPRLLARLQ